MVARKALKELDRLADGGFEQVVRQESMLIEEQYPLKKVQVIHFDGLKGALELMTLPILVVVVSGDEPHHQGNLLVIGLFIFFLFILFLNQSE